MATNFFCPTSQKAKKQTPFKPRTNCCSVFFARVLFLPALSSFISTCRPFLTTQSLALPSVSHVPHHTNTYASYLSARGDNVSSCAFFSSLFIHTNIHAASNTIYKKNVSFTEILEFSAEKTGSIPRVNAEISETSKKYTDTCFGDILYITNFFFSGRLCDKNNKEK